MIAATHKASFAKATGACSVVFLMKRFAGRICRHTGPSVRANAPWRPAGPWYSPGRDRRAPRAERERQSERWPRCLIDPASARLAAAPHFFGRCARSGDDRGYKAVEHARKPSTAAEGGVTPDFSNLQTSRTQSRARSALSHAPPRPTPSPRRAVSTPRTTRVAAARPVAALSKKDLEKVVAGVTVGVGAMMANPLVAEAAVTPSLKNLLNSLVAGGVVLGTIATAVSAVSSFDKIRKE